MRTLILLPLLLSACSQTADKTEPKVPDGESLVGLYERAGVPGRPSRICITGQGTDMRFGINSSFEGPQSCTAKGRVRREGSMLNLVIDGDPACALSATRTDDGVTLNRSEGAECSYYCGGNTELDEGSFVKVGTTEAEARKAVDLVGEPLC